MATLKASGIYVIEHIASKRRYVGSAHDLDVRFKKHLRQLRKGIHHSYKLQEAWHEFGEGAFEFTVLRRCLKSELLVLEQQAIDRLDAAVTGYNVALVAGSPRSGAIVSEETKLKMRASHALRKPISEETRELMRESSKIREQAKKDAGYKVSDETKAKLSDAGKGREFSEETREKIRKANTGKPLSQEHRQKLSDAQRAREKNSEAEVAGRFAGAAKNKGKKRSEEFKRLMSDLASNRSSEHQAKLTAALTGKVLTDMHKQNMAKSARLRHELKVIHDLELDYE